jgi:hypothetical protein
VRRWRQQSGSPRKISKVDLQAIESSISVIRLGDHRA